MSFFSRLFGKNGTAKKKAPEKTADRSIPAQSTTNPLTELRHQAGTGDPNLLGKAHSGKF